MNKHQILLLCAAPLLLLSAPDLFAQRPLELKTVIPGAPARGLYVPNDSKKMDFNGDGVPDMPLMEEEGLSYFLKIVDGSDPENFWVLPEIEDEVVLDFSRAQVMGFHELDGSKTTTEIVLAEKQGRRFINPIVVDADGNLLSVWDDTDVLHLLTVSNMEADITEEIVVFNPQGPQGPRVEIWGVED